MSSNGCDESGNKERDISEPIIKYGDLEGGAVETKSELSRILMGVTNVSLKGATTGQV